MPKARSRWRTPSRSSASRRGHTTASGRWVLLWVAYIAAGALEFAGTMAISKLLTPGAPVYTVISLVVGLTTMVIGGYFATWIRPGAGTVMAGIVMIVVAVLMMTMSGSAPLSYGLAFLVFGPLAALAGGTLCRGRR